MSLLGFNLGIEAMQLAVIAVTLPSVLLLSRTKAGRLVRGAGGVLALLAAGVWATDRTLSFPARLSDILDRLNAHPRWVLPMVALAVAGVWLRRYRRPGMGL